MTHEDDERTELLQAATHEVEHLIPLVTTRDRRTNHLVFFAVMHEVQTLSDRLYSDDSVPMDSQRYVDAREDIETLHELLTALNGEYRASLDL